jgi:hypothetical protein
MVYDAAVAVNRYRYIAFTSPAPHYHYRYREHNVTLMVMRHPVLVNR